MSGRDKSSDRMAISPSVQTSSSQSSISSLMVGSGVQLRTSCPCQLVGNCPSGAEMDPLKELVSRETDFQVCILI